MTVNRGPGVAPIAGVGTTTLEHRLQLAGLYAENAPGVPRSGVLGQATDQLVIAKADWSYDVGPAALVINRTAGEGVYTPTLTGTTNVPTGAAPATNSRWDLIYVKQNDQAKGDANNAAVIGVQQGTAAASPTKPTADLPAGAYVLSEARIFAGTTGTSGGSNTVAQVWRHTAARGAPINVRNTTELAEITPYKGLQIYRTDLDLFCRYNGAAWSAVGAHEEYTSASSGVLNNTPWGPGVPVLDSTKSNSPGFGSWPSDDVFQASVAGLYSFHWYMTWADPAGACYVSIRRNPSGTIITSRQWPSAYEHDLPLPGVRLAANEQVKLIFVQTSGSTIASVPHRVRVTKLA